MPKTRRAFFARAAAPAAASLFAAACGASGQAGDKPAPSAALKGAVRFSFLAQKPHPDVFTKLAGRYQELNPGVTVTAEPSWSWDIAKFTAESVAGAASDVVWMSDNYVTQFFTKGVVREVDSYLSKDRSFKMADYFDTVIEAFKFRNKQIGLPLTFGAYVLHYNKTLFERAGRKLPDDTWTWDTFLDAAKALTRPSTDGSFGQYGFETRMHENAYASWLWNNGGDLFSVDGTKVLFDKPESIEGMQYVVDLIHRHRVTVTPEFTQKQTGANPYGTNAFGATGSVAMTTQAIFMMQTYRQADSLRQMEWDIAPIPKGPKGRTTVSPTAGLAMWSGTKAPDAAWGLMRFLATEESFKMFSELALEGLPVSKAAAQQVIKDTLPPKNKQIYLDAYKYARPAYNTPYGSRAKSEYNSAVRPLFAEGGQVKTAVQAAMPKIQAAFDEEMAADTKK